MATMEEVRALVQRKDNMERELLETMRYLQEVGVGMDGALVDRDGYPRADLDLYAVRLARQKVRCLENDLRAIMKQIEESLHQLHESEGTSGENGYATANGSSTETDLTPHRSSNEPFMKIDQVAPGSPAAEAGLVNNDLVIQFGSLCKTNFTDVRQAAQLVNYSVGRPMRLTVIRNDRPIHITLTPRPWSGQGILGCRVTPINP